ncbi:hypothetical protein HN51_022133, partial [Arachis hypogaea]
MKDKVIVEPLLCFCVIFHDRFFCWFCFCSGGLKHLEHSFGADAVALAEQIWKASERKSLEASIEAAIVRSKLSNLMELILMSFRVIEGLVLVKLQACYGVLRFVMENGAKGCEVIVSGKLRAQRAKSMKFKDGYMIFSGQPVKDYIDSAVRHAYTSKLQLKVDHLLEENARLKRQQQKACIFIYIHKDTHFSKFIAEVSCSKECNKKNGTYAQANKPASADDEDMDPTQYLESRLKYLADQKAEGINPYPHNRNDSRVGRVCLLYGKVYKGILVDGATVTIKRAQEVSLQDAGLRIYAERNAKGSPLATPLSFTIKMKIALGSTK